MWLRLFACIFVFERLRDSTDVRKNDDFTMLALVDWPRSLIRIVVNPIRIHKNLIVESERQLNAAGYGMTTNGVWLGEAQQERAQDRIMPLVRL